VATCLTTVLKDRGSSHTANSCVYHGSNYNIQSWVQSAYPYWSAWVNSAFYLHGTVKWVSAYRLIIIINGLRPEGGCRCKGKGKGLPYSLPSTGSGADPCVQAVSPQMTISHPPGGRLPLLSARSVVTFPAKSITAPWPVPSYTAWWQRHIDVNNLSKVVTQLLPHDLLIASPTLYPLRHRNTCRYGW